MKSPVLAALLSLAAAASAHAAEYQLQLYETPAELAKRTDPGPAGKAYWDSFAAYGKALESAGILRGGAALRAVGEVRTVRMAGGGKPEVGNKPYADSAARLGGYFVIDVDSMEAALTWAAKAPTASSGGAVEVRPFYPVPGMVR